MSTADPYPILITNFMGFYELTWPTSKLDLLPDNLKVPEYYFVERGLEMFHKLS